LDQKIKGEIRMPWYHGTPDIRPLRAGGFTARTEPVRCVRDRAALQAARAHANEAGISDLEAHRRLSLIDAHFEHLPVPVPVFLARTRATAATYATDQRAFDYQGAEPAVLEIDRVPEAEVTIDAGGETFRGLAWGRIAAGLAAAGDDPERVARVLEDRLEVSIAGRIRVAKLGAALHLCGYKVVDVVNVVDTHEGRGRPDTVRMVFDPEGLRIRGAEPTPGP
jgi:hypothetical protein